MSRTLTAADRSALIRLAYTMQKGSSERTALLNILAAVRVYGKHGNAITAIWKAFVPFVIGNSRTKVTLHPQKSLGGRTGYVDIFDLSRGRAKVYFLAGDIGGLRYSLKNLGHELIHVLQYVRGDLQVHGDSIWWKGKPFMKAGEYADLSKEAHDALPWEDEAILKSQQKVRDFLSNRDALRGLDPTLDYLLDYDPEWP